MALRELLPSKTRRRRGVDEATRRPLKWFVMPVWLGAGLADWWCHRRTDIEHTAGVRESAIHAAMMLEGGLPTLLGLFCEVDAGVLALTYATLAVHEVTAVLDVAYADGRREVTPDRAARARLPGTGVADGDRVPHRAALGSGARRDRAGGRPDWRIHGKRRPVSGRYRAGVLGAVTALVALAYGEELLRCLRAARGSCRRRGIADAASLPTR